MSPTARSATATEFHDYEESDRRRLLIRLWLRNEGAQGYMG